LFAAVHESGCGRYLNQAKLLKPELEKIDGFIDNERFGSKRDERRVAAPGKADEATSFKSDLRCRISQYLVQVILILKAIVAPHRDFSNYPSDARLSR
jgi:hypothetical protein